MYDESTNTSSAANFEQLKEECSRLVRLYSDEISSYNYPNVAILASEHNAMIAKINIEEYGRRMYKNNNKILFIKFLRQRFTTMNLIEAKMMADGFWLRFDYLAGENR